jgi:hypothetical protein
MRFSVIPFSKQILHFDFRANSEEKNASLVAANSGPLLTDYELPPGCSATSHHRRRVVSSERRYPHEQKQLEGSM